MILLYPVSCVTLFLFLENCFCSDRHGDAKISWVNFVVTFWIEVAPKFAFLTRFYRNIILGIRNCIVVIGKAVIFHHLLKKMVRIVVHFILIFPQSRRHVWDFGLFMIIRNNTGRAVREFIHVISWFVICVIDLAIITHELSSLEIWN